MKRIYSKYKEVIFVFLFAFFFCLPLFGGFYESHDNETHAARVAQYFIAIKDGQFPPRWAPTLNYEHGSTMMLFYYPLIGYISSFLHFLDISYENSFLIVAFISSFVGPIFFYFWINKLFDKKTALISTIFFTFLPYRFLTLYVRGGIGEFLSFSFIPLFLYSVERSQNKIKPSSILLSSFTYGIIVLSHNGISLFFTPVFLLYSFLKGKKTLIHSFISIFLGLLMTAFFWIPAIYESKYTNGLFYFRNMYKEHFPSLDKLVYSNWGFGPDVNLSGGLSPQLGIFSFAILFICILFILKNIADIKKGKHLLIIFWTVIFLLGVFISSSFSSIIWELSDFLKKFQFPWRFITISSFAAAILSAYFFSKIKNNKLLIILVIFIILYSLPFLKVKQYVNKSNSYYESYQGSTYFRNEGTTIWMPGDPGQKAKNQFEIVDGKGKISNVIKKSNVHKFTTDNQTPVILLDNTIYFPGWKAYVDNKEILVEFQDILYRGIIEIKIPEGKHNIKIVFEETRVRHFSNLISLLGLTIFTVLFIKSIVLRSK